MQQLRKRDSLVFKFTVMSLVFSIIMLSIMGVLTYVIQTDTYTKQCLDITRNVNKYLEYLMQKEGRNTVDYIEYYMNNYRNIEMSVDFEDYEDAMDEYEKIMSRDHPGQTLYVDTSFDELSDDAKKAFFIYDHQYWITTFEAARDAFGLTYTYFMVMGDPRARVELLPERYDEGTYDEEHNVFYLIDCERVEEVDENDKGTGLLVLGDTWFNGYDADHKIEWDTWYSGKQIEEFQKWDNKWGCTYAYYTPLVIDGQKLGLIVSELEVANVNQGILYSSLIQAACLAAVFVVLIVIAVVLINKFYISKLAKLESYITDFTNNKNYEITDNIKKLVKGHNEITSLSEKTADMISEIKVHVDEITVMSVKQEKINAELGIATKIQADMLPRDFPKRGDIELYAAMTPAKEVGGDFYDFFFIDGDHIALVMADVSGKGVPAALFCVVAKAVLRDKAMLGGDPAKMLYEVNNILCQNNGAGLFITVWLGILDVKTGFVQYCNAGHEYPIIDLHGDKVEVIHNDNCPPLAAMENTEFINESVQLKNGDSLFLYTDGVPEAKSAGGERFGMDKLVEILERNKNSSPEQTVADVKREVDAFQPENDPFDDVTIMSVVWKGGNN